MNTPEEIDENYSKNYARYMAYIMNKKGGGDKAGVARDAATEILHDCYCYHKANPQHFNDKYVWNLFKQRRSNYLRDAGNYNSLKESFFNNFYEASVHNTEGLEGAVAYNQMSNIITKEVREVRNKKHQLILKSHLLEGNTIAYDNWAAKKAVKRFKDKLVEKYGEGNN